MEVVICAIARLENKYVKEWVDYHLSIGFSRICIYDNNRQGEECIDDVLHCNDNYLNRVFVIPFHNVVDWPQVQAYNEFWKTQSFDWALFIDVDEFFTFGSAWDGQKDVSVFCENIGRCADAILLNWMVYGDNGQINFCDKLVVERFIKPLPLRFSATNVFGKQPINGHVKTFVRRDADFHVCGPHVGVGNYKCCNADGVEVKNTAYQWRPTYQQAYIRHYLTKSISEFIDCKLRRGLADRSAGRNYDFSDFFLYNRPTIRKILKYREARISASLPERPLLWWVKQYIKHYIITPLCMK